MSKKEFYNTFNTLACIPKILVKQKAIVYLRNDCWVAGNVIDADGYESKKLKNFSLKYFFLAS